MRRNWDERGNVPLGGDLTVSMLAEEAEDLFLSME